jgi:hypothetical protein
MIKVTPIAAYKTYSCNIDKNASVLVTIQPDLAKDIRLQSVLTKHGQQMQLAQFSGILKVKNHTYELVAAEREPSQQLIGQMKSKELLIKHFQFDRRDPILYSVLELYQRKITKMIIG